MTANSRMERPLGSHHQVGDARFATSDVGDLAHRRHPVLRLQHLLDRFGPIAASTPRRSLTNPWKLVGVTVSCPTFSTVRTSSLQCRCTLLTVGWFLGARTGHATDPQAPRNARNHDHLSTAQHTGTRTTGARVDQEQTPNWSTGTEGSCSNLRAIPPASPLMSTDRGRGVWRVATCKCVCRTHLQLQSTSDSAAVPDFLPGFEFTPSTAVPHSGLRTDSFLRAMGYLTTGTPNRSIISAAMNSAASFWP